jgi:hypothetical protein
LAAPELPLGLRNYALFPHRAPPASCQSDLKRAEKSRAHYRILIFGSWYVIINSGTIGMKEIWA